MSDLDDMTNKEICNNLEKTRLRLSRNGTLRTYEDELIIQIIKRLSEELIERKDNDDEKYYFISYSWRTKEDWSVTKEKLEKGIKIEYDPWNFGERCIKVHPFKWISDERTCAGQPSNTDKALIYWKEISKEEYNIWLSTEHRNHY